MSTPRGIFENFPNQSPPSGAPPASPFGIAAEAKPAQAQNPSASAPAAKKESPFSVVTEDKGQNEKKTVRLPERRKPTDSPFQISEPQGFGFEAPQQSPQALKASPFEPAPSVRQASVSGDSANSDSYSIKQLELRAIFGVDREMTNEEIIQRSRSLPGIRQIARVSESDIGAVDALNQVISNLGFVPIEFIREGKTLLAVQTDGGFAPGVRETLMLVARELSK